jgi:hypothetical protein
MGMNSVVEARSQALHALEVLNGGEPNVVILRAAADCTRRIVADHDSRPVAVAWRTYALALQAIAHLLEWKQAVRRAERESCRHLDAARLVASEGGAQLEPSDPLLGRLREVTDLIAKVSSPADIPQCIERLRLVALPLPVADPPELPVRHETVTTVEAPEPIVVVLLDLNGEPAPDAALVPVHRFNDLRLQLRSSEWPEWADHLEATAVSIAGDNASFPVFRFPRPDSRDEGGLWTVEKDGKIVLRASQPLGSDPITFTLLIEFVTSQSSMRQVARTVGQRELRLWATDEARDAFFSGYSQLDQRLAKIFATLWDNPSYGADSERRAFVRFLRALLMAATALQRRHRYPDPSVTERQLQTDLMLLLDQHVELSGRLSEGVAIGGGQTDIVHDRIVAELKVERDRPVSIENVSQFLGQTTSYASGLGSQLGIVVVLDMSHKRSPVGVPANYVHWLQPKVHGVVAPEYPSHVAVLVINGNLPRPSEFGDVRVETHK